MKYEIEIEEAERTLEFTLDVECNYWDIAAHTSGPPEDCCEADGGFDIISVDIDSIKIVDNDGCSIALEDGGQFNAINEVYSPQVYALLEEDEKLFDAWKKHIEEV
jgi:hypothetical protein